MLTRQIPALHRRQHMFQYGFGITQQNEQRRFQDALKQWERALQSASKRTCGQAVSTDTTSTCPAAGAALCRVDAVGADVWTNLANALAIQAASKGATTTMTKKGFKAFPITMQQMILFASEQDKAGLARSAPADTYTEILGLTNAKYVTQHLYHHLKTRLGLDVLLLSGFCSAIRVASFIVTTNDGPEAFSLFFAALSRWSRSS